MFILSIRPNTQGLLPRPHCGPPRWPWSPRQGAGWVGTRPSCTRGTSKSLLHLVALGWGSRTRVSCVGAVPGSASRADSASRVEWPQGLHCVLEGPLSPTEPRGDRRGPGEPAGCRRSSRCAQTLVWMAGWGGPMDVTGGPAPPPPGSGATGRPTVGKPFLNLPRGTHRTEQGSRAERACGGTDRPRWGSTSLPAVALSVFWGNLHRPWCWGRYGGQRTVY